jgi:four helix bundle protein
MPAYDLEQRTTSFGLAIISLCKNIQRNQVSLPLISQLVRSASSVGANYMEANGANSKKDFIYKISLCKKEANESKYWLTMLESCIVDDFTEIRRLKKESHELTLIFQKIAHSSKHNTLGAF